MKNFSDFVEKDADMSVVTIPYVIGIPYINGNK